MGNVGLISYVFAAMAGICFVKGLVLLSSERRQLLMLDGFEAIISMLDYSLDTKRKRHIVGGALLSISLFFGGLAFNTMTLRMEGEKDNE